MDRVLAETADTIREGIRTGDFIDQVPGLVVEVLDAVINQAVRWTPEQRDPVTPDDVATLIMRLVLKRPARIPAIRREADRALREARVPWDEDLGAAALLASR